MAKLDLSFITQRLFTVLTMGLVIMLVITACTVQATLTTTVNITIQVDGKTLQTQTPAGTTIQSVLELNGVALGTLDRVDPPTFTLVAVPVTVKVIRTQEIFEVEETTILFQRQTVKNESLPEGQKLLVQPGVNGLQQTTYRRVIEDGVEVSRTIVKSITLIDPKPEIEMVGVQATFSPVTIHQTIAYLAAGNAWIMQRTSAERKPIVTTGDLDGRIFSISPDGKWLLYTRKSSKPAAEEINSLWVVSLTENTPKPVDLKTQNIIHFAEWTPGSQNTVLYSTVEPRQASPGWQANNDLRSLTFSSTTTYVRQDEILPSGSGGIYGWWGTSFIWSRDGKSLAFARPDSIGLVNLEKKALSPLINLLPYQARGDWAWVPGLAWSNDRKVLFTVTHARKPGLASEETSPIFDLTGYLPDNGVSINLTTQAGMFAYPAVSPQLASKRAFVASLQAIFPEKSETSRYQLMIMEEDGSNKKNIFPPQGSPGLDPQQVVWSPLPQQGTPLLAVIYQGNLWVINPVSGENRQLTGDGLINRIDWK